MKYDRIDYDQLERDIRAFQRGDVVMLLKMQFLADRLEDARKRARKAIPIERALLAHVADDDIQRFGDECLRLVFIYRLAGEAAQARQTLNAMIARIRDREPVMSSYVCAAAFLLNDDFATDRVVRTVRTDSYSGRLLVAWNEKDSRHIAELLEDTERTICGDRPGVHFTHSRKSPIPQATDSWEWVIAKQLHDQLVHNGIPVGAR